MALAARRAAPAAQPPAAPQWSGYADVSELDRYKLVSNIGKGSFGVISKVQRVDDGREFAMKQLDYSKMTEKDRKQILAEV
jgi:NIMA (never in mitosis gene a)-related kinase